MALVAAGTVAFGASPFWYDVITNLPLGCITTNPPSANSFSNWYPHLPGSLTANDLLIVSNNYTSGAAVSGRRLRVDGSKSEYIMRLFDPANTNSYPPGNGTVLYASFIADASAVPGAGIGTYFAAFNSADTNTPPQAVNNGFDFSGHVFQIGQTNAYPFTNRVSNTFRFGVANTNNDPSRGGIISSIPFVPIDLAGGIDYQVVLRYAVDTGTASLWVNPSSEIDTADMVTCTDPSPPLHGLAGLLFRQISPGGAVDLRDIVVGTNFTDVMTNVLASSSVQVATNFNTVTNWPGNPALLEVFATSIGGGPLSYQWYRISGGTTNAVGGNSQAYLVGQLAGSNAGNYFCAVTNAAGKGALSTTNFYISVPPNAGLGFASQSASQTSFVGGAIGLSCSVTGNGPLTFQWKLNGVALTDGLPATGNVGDLSVVSGSQTPNLTISSVSTNDTGDYSVTVTTTAGVSPNSISSTNAHLTVNPPQQVSIAFLRSLLDTNTWLASDTDSVWSVTGTITTFTNITTGNTASYYIQDNTAGINLFVSGNSSFRPAQGSVVHAAGVLSSFNSTLELMVNAGNPYLFYSVVSSNAPLPTPIGILPTITNDLPTVEHLEGSLVALTDVYFTSTTTLGSANTTIGVTNSSGVPFTIFFPNGMDQDSRNKTLPAYAYSVTGPLGQNLSNNVTPRNTGYEIIVTRFSDIVTNPAPPIILSQPQSQTNIAGASLAFAVVAGGAGPLGYRWQFSGTNLNDNGRITGSQSTNLNIANVQLSDAGSYQVVVTNAYGSVTSTVVTLTVDVCTPPVAGLVGWWRGEGSADDFAGTNNGTLVGIGFAQGKVGLGFAPVGTNSFVAVADNPVLNQPRFSVETWAFIDPAALTNNNSAMVAKGNGSSSDGGFFLGYEDSVTYTNSVTFQVYAGNARYSRPRVVNAFPVAGFYHLAGTFDGAVARLYLNGALVNTDAPTDPMAYNNFPLTIGASSLHPSGSHYQFRGVVDEVSFYNRTLSSNEIAAIYIAGTAGKCLSSAPNIVLQPQSQAVAAGSNAAITVIAAGSPALAYRWQFNGTNLADNGRITGSQNLNLNIANAQLGDAGGYQVIVTNAFGSITSSIATLAVDVCTPPAAGLVSWWQGEGNALDSAGTNNGVLQNGAGFQPGYVGDAFSFDGVNDFVSMPQQIGGHRTFTLQAWIMVDPTLAVYGAIVTTRDGDVEYNPATGRFQLQIWGDRNGCYTNGVRYWYDVPFTLQTNQWHHVAWAVSADDTGLLYVDGQGVNVGSRIFDGGVLSHYDTTIGGNSPRMLDYFKGLIDEVAIHNRALGSSEISSIYAAGVAGMCLSSAPVIAMQPQSQAVPVGSNATITVIAAGSPPLSYQWQFNGTNLTDNGRITGSQSTNLTIANLQLTDAGNYQAIVTNAYGSVTSAVVTLTVDVCTPPAADLVGWWQGEGNFNDLAGQNNGISFGISSVSFAPGRVGQAMLFNPQSMVLISNAPAFSFGANQDFTAAAWVNLQQPQPGRHDTILWQIDSGATGTAANGWWLQIRADTRFPIFQQEVNAVESSLISSNSVPTNVWTHLAAVRTGATGLIYINGALAASGTIPTNSLANTFPLSIGGIYDTRSNPPMQPNTGLGGLIDEVSIFRRALSSNEIAAIYAADTAGMCLSSPPAIASQPQSQTVAAGSNATFVVSAGGTPPLNYQWQLNGTNLIDYAHLNGSQSASLTITNAQLSDTGSYQVIVTNAYGSTTSAVATLTVPAAVVSINGQITNNYVIDSPTPTNVLITIQGFPTNATIRYTLDGSVPSSSSPLYTGQFFVTAPAQIRAAAFASGGTGYSPPVFITAIPYYYLTNATLGGGSVMLSNSTLPAISGPYRTNTQLTLTAAPLPGWTFLQWQGDVSGTNNQVSLSMNGPHTVQAVFGHSLTVNVQAAGASGVVSNAPPGPLYNYGQTVLLSGLPDSNSLLAGWGTGGAVQFTVNPLPLVIDEIHTAITAYFLPKPQTNLLLNVTVTGQGVVTLDPSYSSYPSNTFVSLQAVPAANYVFDQWTNNASGTQNPLTLQVTTNLTVTARFVPRLPPLVNMLSPPGGTTNFGPTNLVLTASASSSNSTIQRLEFYDGTNLLATVPNASALVTNNVTITNLLPRTNAYLIFAHAVDARGLDGFSQTNSVTIQAFPDYVTFGFLSTPTTIPDYYTFAQVRVLKFGQGVGAVAFATQPITAQPVVNGVGSFYSTNGILNFTTNQTYQDIFVALNDDPVYEGNQTFGIQLTPQGRAGLTGSGLYVVTIIESTPLGAASFLQYVAPPPPPAATNSLRVWLQPLPANGQWRFAWENTWRTNGTAVSSLLAGNYDLEFRPVPNFGPLLPVTVAVPEGGEKDFTNNYQATAQPPTGALGVQITGPTGLGWRFLGDSTFNLQANSLVQGLTEGDYTIEFSTVTNYVEPDPKPIRIWAGEETDINVSYLQADPSSTNRLTLAPLPNYAAIRDSATNQPAINEVLPYAWVGQLRAGGAFGSGCAVRDRVVLTAGHVVFDTVRLVSAGDVYWFAQRQTGEYEPKPLQPRGWLLLDGYAQGLQAHESFDQTSELDAAALYFSSAFAVRGGYSGYLVDDQGAWLLNTTNHTLVGYPTRNMLDVEKGQMHAAPTNNYHFAQFSSALAPEIFISTNFAGYPGASGGPLCVLVSNVWYPAGVYLGVTSDGNARVRAIDGPLGLLIQQAEDTANASVNQTDNGAPIPTGIATNVDFAVNLTINVGPSNLLAVLQSLRTNLSCQVGDGKSLPPYLTFTFSNSLSLTTIIDSRYAQSIIFGPVAGWQTPASANITISANDTTIFATYQSNGPPQLSFPALSNGFSGAQATILANASGAGPLGYRWFKNGQFFLSTTNPSLPFAILSPNSAGTYILQVSNSFGVVTSAPAQLLVGPSPQLVVGPLLQWQGTNLLILWTAGRTAVVQTATRLAPTGANWIAFRTNILTNGQQFLDTTGWLNPTQQTGFLRLYMLP